MKKLLSLLLAMLLMVSCTGVAFAQAEEQEALTSQEAASEDFATKAEAMMYKMMDEMGYTEVEAISAAQARSQIDVAPEVMELAYSDIDAADARQREKILAAREEVISKAEAWHADEGIFVVDVEPEAKTWRRIPKFSELFPGWDLPRYPAPEEDSTAEPVSSVDMADEGIDPLANGYLTDDRVIRVYKFVPHTITYPFLRWYNLEATLYSFAETASEFSGFSQINLGVTDSSTGASIYARTKLSSGTQITGLIDGSEYPNVEFRASNYEKDGDARIRLLRRKVF